MDRRKLFCFNPTAAEDGFLDELRARGWDIQTVTRLDEAKSLVDLHRYHVGLVIFGSREHADLSAIQALLGMHFAMEWVALVPAAAMHSRDVCQLISQGFYDFHTLPFDCERLQITLGHAFGMAQVQKRLRTQVGGYGDDGIIGCSAPISKVFSEIATAAAVDVPVLITGEGGVGKELAARAIHRRSGRVDQPFVVLSCGALASDLMRSELFGHEQGAFPGASRARPGSIEAASGGTLFLDEVADLPSDMQTMLARFLQDRTIRRIGGDEDVAIDVRVVASTHGDLENAVATGFFREDLYRALNVLHVSMPSLRDRVEDIELLGKYYLDMFITDKYRHIKGFAPEAVAAMEHYPWPGNVRELVNRVRRAMVMCQGQWIAPTDLGLTEPDNGVSNFLTQNMTLEQAKSEAEKEIIRLTLKATDNNISRAARQLSVSRMTLYRLMHKHKIRGGQDMGELADVS